jgi:hypothetical protein
MKNWKLSLKISVVLSAVTAICLTVMFLLSNHNMTADSIMKVAQENSENAKQINDIIVRFQS